MPGAWVINKKIQNCSFMRANLSYLLLPRPAGKVNWKVNIGKPTTRKASGYTSLGKTGGQRGGRSVPFINGTSAAGDLRQDGCPGVLSVGWDGGGCLV